MIEQKIKALLGEYAFTITALQTQIEQLQAQIKDFTKEDENQLKRSKTN